MTASMDQGATASPAAERIKALLVDDEAVDWDGELRSELSCHGVALVCESDPARALGRVEQERPDVVLLDVLFPSASGDSKPEGTALLARLVEDWPSIPVVMFTVALSDEAWSLDVSAFPGAAYVFSKSVFSESLLEGHGSARPCADLSECLKRAVYEAKERADLDERVGWVVGQTPSMKRLALDVLRVAPTELSVLIGGESGTGKELVAQTLHRLSARSSGPFIKVNCGAFSDETLESALFGHEKGAFTDAKSAKAGLFEEASEGTLFLDEAQSMSPRMQQALLRVLQEKVIRRMGSTQERKVDVRVLVATNEDLQEKMERGGFRDDLYYRLNRVRLVVPPLRERKQDLPVLFARFVVSANRKLGRSVSRKCRPDVLQLLQSYDWPGNIRELESAIETAVALANSNLLTPADFPQVPVRVSMRGGIAPANVTGNLPATSIEVTSKVASLRWAQLRDIKGEPRKKLLLEYIDWHQSASGRRPTSASLADSLGTSADNVRRVLSELGIRLRDL